MLTEKQMEKFIVAGGVALRVSDTLKGAPAVVLLHGYLESLDVWEEFTKLLAPRFRVVAMDIPGHGISQVMGPVHTMEGIADVIKGVLDSLGVEKCFIAGHSMGGYAAEAFAAVYPEMLQGLILFHSTPNPDSEEKKEDRRREIEMVRANKKELIASLFAPKGFAPGNRRRLSSRITELEEIMTMSDDEGIEAILRGLMERKDQNEMLRGLKVPQLFIFGRDDVFIPLAAAEKIASEHPQAEVAWLENSGHMGFMEEPEVSAQIISSFVERHSAAGQGE